MSFATTQFLGNFYHFNNILHLSSFLILCFGKRKGKGGKQKYSYQIAMSYMGHCGPQLFSHVFIYKVNCQLP
jgi:hypothetical protein